MHSEEASKCSLSDLQGAVTVASTLQSITLAPKLLAGLLSSLDCIIDASTAQTAPIVESYVNDACLQLSGPLFPSAKEVNVAIQDTVALLQVPRSSLGICCSSRGAVAGEQLECSHWY
jgi:hypothetical protein